MGESVAVSVVLPAYNEEARLETAVDRTLAALGEFLPADTFEVIVAEDGCTDRTPAIAARLADEDDRVRHLHSEARLGRGRALAEAFSIADGRVLAYLDTDLATDLRHLEELIETVRSGTADVAIGSRWLPGHGADRPLRRRVPSWGYNALVRWLLRSSVRDHQCGFKAFDRAVLFDLLESVEDEHWFWDTEVLVRAQRAGYRVAEFPVEWTPKTDTKVELVRDVLGMGSQIVRTWWQLSIRPRITPRRSIAAGVLLTLAAIGLMTVYLDPAEVVAELGTAADRNPGLLVAAALVYGLSWPLRGARYGAILSRLGYEVGTGFLTGAVFISQTGNLVFPARAGDAVRAYLMKSRRRVPYPSGFASLAVERVFDLLTITALAGAVLLGLLATDAEALRTLQAGLAGSGLPSGRVAIRVAAVVGLLALLAVVTIVATARSDRNRVRAIVEGISDDSYAGEVASVLERFVADLQTVAASPGAFGRVGAASLLIWAIDVLTAVLVLLAFEPAVPAVVLVPVCFFAVSVGNLAKVLPLSPGGIGLYEGAFTLILVATTPVPVALALGAAIVDHAIKNAVTILGGAAAMVALNVSLLRAVEEGSTEAGAADDAPEPSRTETG